jgi:hypothetical protein
MMVIKWNNKKLPSLVEVQEGKNHNIRIQHLKNQKFLNKKKLYKKNLKCHLQINLKVPV